MPSGARPRLLPLTQSFRLVLETLSGDAFFREMKNHHFYAIRLNLVGAVADAEALVLRVPQFEQNHGAPERILVGLVQIFSDFLCRRRLALLN